MDTQQARRGGAHGQALAAHSRHNKAYISADTLGRQGRKAGRGAEEVQIYFSQTTPYTWQHTQAAIKILAANFK